VASNLDKILLLRSIWSFRVHWTLNPRSTALDLFLNAICQLYAADNYIEYGAFKGESAFFNTSLTTHGYLIDNFSQVNYYRDFDKQKIINYDVVNRNIQQLLQINMQLIGNTNYSIIDMDVKNNAIIDKDAGVIFWDLFNKNRDIEVDCLLNVINDCITKSKKVIIIVDDAVHERGDDNILFNRKWKKIYESRISKYFTPLAVTSNRVYLSNFQVDPGFNKILQLFEKIKYIKQQQPSKTSELYGQPIYDSIIDFSSMEFIENDQLWADLSKCLSNI
jgi:hypothetical protein